MIGTPSIAQTGYNYYGWGLGLGADLSYERAYTSIPDETHHLAAGLNFIYNFSPYTSIAAELQFGTLSGGSLLFSQDSLGQQYINHYMAFLVHSDFGLGEVLKYSNSHVLNVLKNIYVGTGFGFIFNNNTVQRTNINPNNGPFTYFFPGSDSEVNLIVPLRIGYEFKIYDKYDEPSCAIDLGYTRTLVFGSGVTGYDNPPGNSRIDQYGQFVVGFKFFYGKLHSYHKPIRAFGD